MSTDPYVKYYHEVKKIEDAKARLVWNLMILEQHLDDSHDSQACQTLLEIASDLEKVVDVTKSNKNIPKIPEVVTELKLINDFTQKLETIIRGRSWFSICREFESTDSLDNIKELKSILKRSGKKAVNRRPRVTDNNEGGGGLVDDDDWQEYTNRPQETKDRMKNLRDRIEVRKTERRILAKDIDMKVLDVKNLWK